MRRRCPRAKVIGTSVLDGYRLMFKGSGTGAYLTIEPRAGRKVPVAVYLVTEEDESVSAPHIVSCALQGVRSEVLLHALEEKGVYVSSGSACSSNRKSPVSSVIQEIHLKKELRESVIRFSFSDRTTTEEIDYALAALRELLPVLRRYSRR